MKILGKNVFIGTKKLCIEFTSRINGDNEYKGKCLEKDVIFIKDRNGYYIDLKDTIGNEFLSIAIFGGAPRWKLSPIKPGDQYIDDIRPYFDEKNQNSLFTIKALAKHITAQDGITIN